MSSPLPDFYKNQRYRRLASPKDAGLHQIKTSAGKLLSVPADALTLLAREAFHDIQHYFRQSHVEQLADILKSDDASENDRYVAGELLKNAEIAAEGEYPSCQDTGTAIVLGRRGDKVLVEGDDIAAISDGVKKSYSESNFRYSQLLPSSLFEEKNTGSNLPAQIEIEAGKGAAYDFLFVAKGGGSANKSFLFQETRALLTPEKFENFLREKLPGLGTAACPPYHLALVVGGTSAELTMKAVKLASTGCLDFLPATGPACALRDRKAEELVMRVSRELGLGAQFGGNYFCLDARVIRLPRHGASCPVGIGVSCVADRNALGRITSDGVFLEDFERNPGRFLSAELEKIDSPAMNIDLTRPMDEICSELSKLPVASRLKLNGSLIVARDIAHVRLLERLKKEGRLPEYMLNHPVYYAGPAKTPQGRASGSFGPTTAGRMDSYVREFQKAGGSRVMLAKGNRSPQVTESCREHGGFYLGSIGGAAARIGRENIVKTEVIDYPELGMEAVYRIEVRDFPAFVIVDDKGNDFFTRKKT